MIAGVTSGAGSPAVTKGIRAGRPAARSFSKVADIRFIDGASQPRRLI
jgi:hypothetical protein